MKPELPRALALPPGPDYQGLPDDCLESAVPGWIERQVKLRPDHPAVSSGGVTVSYAELNRAANRLAHALLARSGEWEPVLILVDHSVELVIALLGVAKAGKATVVVAPSTTARQIDDLRLDSGYRTAVTTRAYRDRLRPGEVVLVAEADGPDTNPGLEIPPDTILSLIYTSGTTGRPKGVCRPHSAMMANVLQYSLRTRLCPSDRVALLQAVAAGTLLGTVYGSLSHGACLVPFDLRQHHWGQLAGWLRRERVTLLSCVASVFRNFAATLGPDDAFPELRQVRIGGETILAGDLQLFRRQFGSHTTLRVGIGASEASEMASWILYPGDPPDDGVVPLGWPLPGTSLRILGPDGRERGAGKIGEIEVCSPAVASGYWRREELTRQKFAQDPKSARNRVFRTGDLGRLRADGQLEHHGRLDSQFQIRGNRVEPGEIEGALLSDERVAEAAVSVQNIDPLGEALVAHIVPAAGRQPTTSQLRRQLLVHLPAHLVPSYFVLLDGLPRTATGKVDRSALPEVQLERPSLEVDYRPPEGSVERLLVACFVELLQVPEIGTRDSFFDLGGHSLQVIRLASKVFDLFGVEIQVAEFFENPTVAWLARTLETDAAVSSRIERIAERQLSGRRERPSGLRMSAGEEAPLSFSQQRLWFLSRLEPDSRAYYIAKTFRIRGPLDVEALSSAYSAVIRRHAVLRTTCHVSESGPFQRVEDRTGVLRVVDLSDGPADQRLAAAAEQIEAERRRLFDLSRDLPIRASLYRLDDRSHLLATTCHHIATDAWSMGILWHELSAGYEAALAGTEAVSSPLEVQYTEYARRQRERAGTELFQRHLETLRERLAGAPPISAFPADRPRPLAQTYRGAVKRVRFRPGLLADLQLTARRQGATVYMLLLAALKVLLHRYSGQEDLVVGSPTAGRLRSELEPLIGFFVNNLVLRTDLSGDPTFLELLGRVRAVCLEALETQEVPFERLVEELSPDRSLAYSPLFQVVLSLRNAPGSTLQLEGLDVEEAETAADTAKFDWWLSLRERGDVLEGFLEYSTDLYDGVTIEDHLANLASLLESVAADPKRRISELTVVSDPERDQLERWNRTGVQWSDSGLAFQQFERRAVADGDRIALRTPGETLTYRQLNRGANRLARFLMDQGVRVGTTVGIHLERGPDLLVSVLGVLKAGGAYVPLDPDYPVARLSDIRRRAGVNLTLTRSDPPPDIGGTFLSLDAERQRIEALPDRDPDVAVPADSTAYINFTSGSTGRPKGVVIPHSALKNLLESMRREPGLEPDDLLFSVTSLSFDIATLELLLPLITGAAVYIAPSDAVRDAERLRVVLEESGANVMQSTPSGWRLLLEAGWSDPSVKALCGGEELTPELARRLLETTGQVWNLYGPTETTIWSTAARLRADEPVTIGSPIANTTVFVLDTARRLLPRGSAGELYIGGAGVAAGYLDDPAETTARFIPNPFGPGRLYRTGDLVRWRRDGRLEFLGRNDRQIKLRGFRIELGEIEAVLEQHPAVAQAAVVLWRHSKTALDHLVAHIVAVNDECPPWPELTSFVAGSLPDYMVPRRWNHLAEMPLTPNGKVDRRQLPPPDPDSSPAEATPTTETETRLLKIWRRVLGHEHLGLSDGFFEAGGTSMLALRLVTEVEKAFDRRLPVSLVFTAGTVTGFAAALESDESPAPRPLIAARTTGSRPPLFLAPGHDGDQFTLANLARHLSPDQPLYGLEPLGLENGRKITLPELASHYLEAMRDVSPDGPYFIAGYCSGGVVAWEMARQAQAEGRPIPLLLLLDASPWTLRFKRHPLLRLLRAGQVLRAEWEALRRTRRGRRLEHISSRLHRARRRLEITLIEALQLDGDRVWSRLRPTYSELVSLREVERLHRDAHRDYRPRPYLGRVALVAARRAPLFTPPDLAQLWKEFVPDGLQIRAVDCIRPRLLSEPFVAETALELDRLISAALEESP